MLAVDPVRLSYSQSIPLRVGTQKPLLAFAKPG
jgi:hypothetical protein